MKLFRWIKTKVNDAIGFVIAVVAVIFFLFFGCRGLGEKDNSDKKNEN
jgi:hypothetical protein